MGEPCPCCGLRTLAERSAYSICPVCWWEDDGQDNDEADEVMGGPNADLSLTQARVNVLVHGTASPARRDLRKIRRPPSNYERGRTFLLSSDRTEVSEAGTAWRSAAFRL